MSHVGNTSKVKRKESVKGLAVVVADKGMFVPSSYLDGH
jgi:hypothetical protein